MTRATLIAWASKEAKTWQQQACEEADASRTDGAMYATKQHVYLDAISAMLEADEKAMRSLHDALGAVWGDPEDCADCSARADDDGEPCGIHGPLATSLYHAVQALLELIGPCVCGHPKSHHEGVDSTACKVCECARFTLPPYSHSSSSSSPAPSPSSSQAPS